MSRPTINIDSNLGFPYLHGYESVLTEPVEVQLMPIHNSAIWILPL
jgi:hypothetical protein